MIRFLFAVLLVSPQTPQLSEKAAIEGIVTQITGEPVEGALVILTTADGRNTDFTNRTDAGGRFQIRDVPPGSYRLSAGRDGYVRLEYGQREWNRPGTILTLEPDQRLSDIAMLLVPTGAISGRILDPDGKPVAGVTVQAIRRMYHEGRPTLLPIQQTVTGKSGEYRLASLHPSEYYLSAAYNSNFAVRAWTYALPLEDHPPIYYPGTDDPAAAVPIDLPVGASADAIDFTLYPRPTATIKGRIFSTDGTHPGRAWLSILPGRSPVLSPIGMDRQPIQADGSFEFSGLTAGRYELIGTHYSAIDGRRLSARVPVEITGRDVENVVVALSPGVEVEGRVSLEDSFAELAPFPLNRMTVILRPKTEGQIVIGRTGAVNNDGTFTVRGVEPGDYTLVLGNLPPDYYVRSAHAGSAEIVENGLTVFQDSPGLMDVVLSSKTGSIEGRVTDTDSKPVAAIQVILIPEPRLRNRAEFYKPARTDHNGSFAMRGLRPGNYKVFAWEDIEFGAHMDPAFLANFEGRGSSVRVDPGRTVTVDTKVIPRF